MKPLINKKKTQAPNKITPIIPEKGEERGEERGEVIHQIKDFVNKIYVHKFTSVSRISQIIGDIKGEDDIINTTNIIFNSVLENKSLTELKDLLKRFEDMSRYISKLAMVGIRVEMELAVERYKCGDLVTYVKDISATSGNRITVDCGNLENGKIRLGSGLIKMKAKEVVFDVRNLDIEIQSVDNLMSICNSIKLNESNIIWNRQTLDKISNSIANNLDDLVYNRLGDDTLATDLYIILEVKEIIRNNTPNPTEYTKELGNKLKYLSHRRDSLKSDFEEVIPPDKWDKLISTLADLTTIPVDEKIPEEEYGNKLKYLIEESKKMERKLQFMGIL